MSEPERVIARSNGTTTTNIEAIRERERRAMARAKEIFPGYPEVDFARIEQEAEQA